MSLKDVDTASCDKRETLKLEGSLSAAERRSARGLRLQQRPLPVSQRPMYVVSRGEKLQVIEQASFVIFTPSFSFLFFSFVLFLKSSATERKSFQLFSICRGELTLEQPTDYRGCLGTHHYLLIILGDFDDCF